MDFSAWSEAARDALVQYHLGNLTSAVPLADAAENDREAFLVGALACYESVDPRATRARCEPFLGREPRDAIDRRLRLLARWAIAIREGDPSALQQEIDDALASGDPWIEGAACEHQLDILSLHDSWRTKGRHAPSWETLRGFGERAADAYERAGDRPSVLRIWARLAPNPPSGSEARKIFERVNELGADARSSGDLHALARCASITALLHTRGWIMSGARDEPPRQWVTAALELADLVSAPAYAADVYAVMGDHEPRFLREAATRYGDCGQVGRAFEVVLASAKAAEKLNQLDVAAQTYLIARELADKIQFLPPRVWTRFYLAEVLFRMGRPAEAFAFAEEALAFDTSESAQVTLLMAAANFAMMTHDAPRAIRFFKAAVERLEKDPEDRRMLSLALRGLAAAYRELHDREGFAKGIEALRRSSAIDRDLGDREQEAEKLADLVLLYMRTASHVVRAHEELPQDVRDGAREAIERFRELAAHDRANAGLQTSLLIAEAMYEFRYGSADESFRKLDAAREMAPTAESRNRADVWTGLFAIDRGVETRGVALLRRANEHVESTYRAAEQSTAPDALGGPAQDSARINALLAKLETEPALREAAAAKARERIAVAVDVYEQASRFHQAGDPASAMTSQFGLHRFASLAYQLAVQVHLLLGDTVKAFEAVERLKAIVLAGALAYTELRPPEGVDAELLARERKLLQVYLKDRDPARRGSAREQLRPLWEQMRAMPGGETYVSLRLGETISWSETSRLLDEANHELGGGRRFAIVEYCILGEYPLTDAPSYAFILRGGDAQPLAVPIAMPLNDIGDAVLALHDPNGDKKLWPEHLERLTPLVAPIEEHVAADDVLCIVPSERLYVVPLHAIQLAGGEPLIARHPVCYTPSVTALRTTIHDRRTGSGPRTAAVFGNPTGDLDHAEREASEVANRLGVTPRLREAATAEEFVEALRANDTVHFAGHAYFDSEEPLHSGLILAQHILNAEQLLKLRDGRADLVVLSGCATGVNITSTGDEILGLTRAFLYCGVSTLVQSLWPVADIAAARLMVEFYGNWLEKGMARVDAMRAAMITLRERTKHPFFWAPFTLFGDWR